MSARARGALLAALTMSGCGPTVRSLLEARHYREAVCAAHDERDRPDVERALDLDANLMIHADVIDGPEVRQALSGHRGVAPVSLFRVSAQSDVLPLDAVELTAAVGSLDGRSAAFTARWETLAWATGETLPPRRTTQTYATGGNLLRAGAAVATLGLSLLFSDFRPDTVSIDARPEDYERVAPRATRLHALTERAGCSLHEPGGGAGVRCQWFFLYAASAPSQLVVALTARFVANRADPEHLERAVCAVTRSAVVPLGQPATLAEELDARFGRQARAVRDIELEGARAPLSAWEEAAAITAPR